MLNIAEEVAAMGRMTIDQLRGKYAEVCRESTRSRHRNHLVKRIAWQTQANAEGGLSERARGRAAELADDSHVRATPPRKTDRRAFVKRRTTINGGRR